MNPTPVAGKYHWTPTPQGAEAKDETHKVEVAVTLTSQLIEHNGLDERHAETVTNRIFRAIDAAFPYS